MKTGLCQRVWLNFTRRLKKTTSTFIRRSRQLPLLSQQWQCCKRLGEKHRPRSTYFDSYSSTKTYRSQKFDSAGLLFPGFIDLLNAWGAKGALRGLFKPGFQSDLLSRYPQWLQLNRPLFGPKKTFVSGRCASPDKSNELSLLGALKLNATHLDEKWGCFAEL